MKTYLSNLIPKLQLFSEKLDNVALLTNKHWIVIDDQNNNKTVYIFRTNNELLISMKGKVSKAKWEYVGNNSILIDIKEESYLFRHGFFDENVLALKIDNRNEYAYLVNEHKHESELNSISKIESFLDKVYLTKHIEVKVKTQVSNSINYSNISLPVVTLPKELKKVDYEKIKRDEKTDETLGKIGFSFLALVSFSIAAVAIFAIIYNN